MISPIECHIAIFKPQCGSVLKGFGSGCVKDFDSPNVITAGPAVSYLFDQNLVNIGIFTEVLVGFFDLLGLK